METRVRKRQRSSDEKSGLGCSVVTASNGMRVTPAQLRELWCHDNECGRKYMKGCPLRTCSALDGLITGGGAVDGQGLTLQELEMLKTRIGEMWRNAGALFEIFTKKDEEVKGYRLRVRTDAPLNVSIKPQEALEFGWIAQIPGELLSAHVFNRSALEPNGYLGGPVSYMNWCPPRHRKVTLVKSSSHSICKMYLRGSHSRGKELMWDYGCEDMPELYEWFFPECCQLSTVDPVEKKRHEQYLNNRIHWFRESCVLCGQHFTMGNKDNRVQRKQHFVGAHADYLGSLWDGFGTYALQEVDCDTLLFMADKLNHFLSTLKTMNWNVIPACKVFSNKEELNSFENDPEALKREVCRRKEMFKVGGVVILRGLDAPTTFEHFKPIKPRKWKVIAWKNNIKPPSGRYAVAPELKKEIEDQIPSLVSAFFERYMEIL